MGESAPLEQPQESKPSLLDFDNEVLECTVGAAARSSDPLLSWITGYDLPDPSGGAGAYQLECCAAATQLFTEYKHTSVHFSSEWPVLPHPLVFEDPGLVHGEIGSVPQECSHLAKEWQLGARTKELSGPRVHHGRTSLDLQELPQPAIPDHQCSSSGSTGSRSKDLELHLQLMQDHMEAMRLRARQAEDRLEDVLHGSQANWLPQDQWHPHQQFEPAGLAVRPDIQSRPQSPAPLHVSKSTFSVQFCPIQV
uniref:Uncharacterized protein n=1 Tax=Sphaerodactylus townsendi TaxID=933632 RepID=A0ACB8EU29_9SAUR